MEEGASRIRRRISIRKRAWPGLESVCAAPAEAERAPGEDAAAEEKEEDAGAAGAAGRRRKTAQPAEERAAGSPGPVPTTLGRGPEEDPEPAPPPAQPAAGSTDQCYDSEEDMFGDYDSFTENSILAQVDDLEQKYMQLPEQGTSATDSATEDLCSESVRNKLSVTRVSDITEDETDEHSESQAGCEDVPAEPGGEPSCEVPSSQALYFENLQSSSRDLGCESTKERNRSSSPHKAPREESPSNHPAQPQPDNELSSKVRTSSDTNRRKSIKDYLKSAMTENAKAQTPVFSRNRQLKEALLSEEINVAKETIESSSDDLGPFYSLPSRVRDLYVQFKGIAKLYEWQHTCLTLSCVQERKNLI